MALGSCGPVSGDVYALISNGWANHQSLGLQQYNALEWTMRDLEAFIDRVPLSAVNTEISYSLPADTFGAAFARPTPPDAPDMAFQKPSPVADYEIQTVAGPRLGSKPTWAAVRPDIDLSGEPAPFAWTDIDEAVDLSTVVLPSAPALTLPSVQDLRNRLLTVAIPAARELTLPDWTAQRPVDDTALPVSSFAYVEQAYTGTALSALSSEINRLLAGGTTGLRDEVWALIWQRDTEREQEAALRFTEGVRTRWARAGWNAPGGAAIEAMNRAQQEVMHTQAGKARELAVQQATMEVDNLRKALAEGLALEQTLIQLHQGRQERTLRAAGMAQEFAISIAGVAINRLSARYQGYATDAQVWRERMQGELSRLEQRRLELEEAKIKGEVNEQEVRVFLAQYQAADALIKKYLGELEGVKTLNERDKLQVEILGERIRNRAEKVRAKALEYDGWKARVEGQLGKANLYKVEAEVLGELMRGYAAEADAETKRVDADVRLQGFNLARKQADLARFEAEGRSEAERVAALARRFEGLVRLFESQGRTEESRVNSETNRARVVVDEIRARETLQLEKGRVDAEQILRLLGIEQQSISSILQTRAQLVASMYNAFNLNGSVSGNFENQSICQTTFAG